MNDFTKYKQKLEQELGQLKNDLTKLGTQNPQNLPEWKLKQPEMDIMNADENEAADRNEEYHINSIILDKLVVRYNNVTSAIKKFENDTYGICEISGDKIEKERLDANPAARTCKKHIGETENSQQ